MKAYTAGAVIGLLVGTLLTIFILATTTQDPSSEDIDTLFTWIAALCIFIMGVIFGLLAHICNKFIEAISK